MSDPDLIDGWDASQLLGTTHDGLRSLTRRGLLPVYKIGGKKQSRVRYSRADCLALIEASKTDATSGPLAQGGAR